MANSNTESQPTGVLEASQLERWTANRNAG